MRIRLYEVNSGEALIWSHSTECATETFVELYNEDVNKIETLDKDEIVYLVSVNKETGDYEWTLYPRGNVVRTTTAYKLSKEFDK
jgi:hypothetical protein